MSMKDWTPEQRAENARKSGETRRRNREARAAAAAAAVSSDAPSLTELGLEAPDETDAFTVDATALLSAQEIAQAEEEGRKRHRDEQKKKALQAVRDAAYAKESIRQGTETEGQKQDRVNREMVQIYINMPRLRKPNGGMQDAEPIILDQRVYTSGRYYTVERHVANYLMGLIDINRRYVNVVNGDSQTYYNQSTGTMIYQGGEAAGGGGGPSFDGIHRRPAR